MGDSGPDVLEPRDAVWIGDPPRDQQGRVWLHSGADVDRVSVRWLGGGSRLLCVTFVAGERYTSPTNSTPAFAFEILDGASLETVALIVGPSRWSCDDVSIGPDEKILVATGRRWDDGARDGSEGGSSLDALDLETGATLASFELPDAAFVSVRWLTERVVVVTSAESRKALKRGRGRHQQIDLTSGKSTPIDSVPDRAFVRASVDELSIFDRLVPPNRQSDRGLRSPDGGTLSLDETVGSRSLVKRDAAGKVRAQRVLAEAPRAVDFAPGGRWLAISTASGSTVFDARSGALLRAYDRQIIAFLRDEPLVVARNELVPFALESVDGTLIIRSEHAPRRVGNTVVVGDKSKCTLVGLRGERTVDLRAAASSVLAASVELDAVVALDPTGQRMIVSNRGAFVLPSETRIALSFAFVPSANLVWASYGSRPELRAYSIRSGALVKQLDLGFATRGSRTNALVKEWPLANTLVATIDGTAWHVDGASGEVLAVLASGAQRANLAAWALCDDGVRIAQPAGSLSARVFSIR